MLRLKNTDFVYRASIKTTDENADIYIQFLIWELIESIPVNTDKWIGTTNLQIKMLKTLVI